MLGLPQELLCIENKLQGFSLKNLNDAIWCFCIITIFSEKNDRIQWLHNALNASVPQLNPDIAAMKLKLWYITNNMSRLKIEQILL